MKRIISRKVAILLMLLMVTCFTVTGLAATDEDYVVISKSAFPDASLRSCLLEMYPEGKISRDELDSRKTLDVSGKGIRDLKGVELFENLQEINCSNNEITEINYNTYCELRNLKHFDISNNQSLKALTITGVYDESYDGDDYRRFVHEENVVLESLNVSGCTALSQLDCSSNLLRTMDIDGCAALVKLNCSNNNLKELDVRMCVPLEELDCSSNILSVLNVSGCYELMYLNCGDNCLTALDVHGLSSLIQLSCNNNRLTSLTLAGKTLLIIDCSNNKLSTLDLREVKFTDTMDDRYDRDSFPVLADAFGIIYCQGNLLTALSLPAGEKISVLDCRDNNLTELDLSRVIFLARNGYSSDLYYDKSRVKTLLLPKYKIENLPDREYKGKPVEYNVKSVNLSMGGYELNESEKMFTLEKFKYKNNNSIGLATVNVRDFNGISGTQTFCIVPCRAAIKKLTAGKKKIKVTIKKQPGDVKYQISVKRKGGKAAEKKYTVKKGTVKTIKGLKKNTKYTVKVRAFKKVKGNIYWGKWSKAKNVKVR